MGHLQTIVVPVTVFRARRQGRPTGYEQVVSYQVMCFQHETDTNITGYVICTHDAIHVCCANDALALEIKVHGNSDSPTDPSPVSSAWGRRRISNGSLSQQDTA